MQSWDINTIRFKSEHKNSAECFKSHLIIHSYHSNIQHIALKYEFFIPIIRAFYAAAILTTAWTISPLLKKRCLSKMKWRYLKVRCFQSYFRTTNYVPKKYDWMIKCDLNLWVLRHFRWWIVVLVSFWQYNKRILFVYRSDK